ncbi:hypothetical protein SHKM778_31010 [Streptomyces sp. KM77-8]|uniref:Uncharacterized protein n=1 Tax=Streptomyces haneummycinicus TaxID=3074435 RepID=A0AAT9HHD1_9ACTN
MTSPASSTGSTLSSYTFWFPRPNWVWGEVLRTPVLDIGARHEIGRVGKRGHPVASFEPGVPADVVVVQMGVDDDVDVLGADAGRGEIVQVTRVQIGPDGLERTVLAVARTGVDQDDPAFAAQRPGLGGDARQVGAGVPVIRVQQGGVALPLLRLGTGEEHVGRHRRDVGELHDTGDLDVPQFHRDDLGLRGRGGGHVATSIRWEGL